jgi:hypothetical protein
MILRKVTTYNIHGMYIYSETSISVSQGTVRKKMINARKKQLQESIKCTRNMRKNNKN